LRLSAGALNVAVTAKGAISAKYSGTEGKTVSFSGNWRDLDERGAAVATLTAKGATLDLSMDDEGRLSATLSLPEGYSAFDGFFTAEAPWPQTGAFGSFKGYYTVALPQTGVVAVTNIPSGDAFLTLTMTSPSAVKNGTVRFAGILPDGSSVSGYAPIADIEADGSFAVVPVVARAGKNVLGAVLAIDADGASKWDSGEGFIDKHGNEWMEREVVRGADGTGHYVLHRETALSYETRHGIYGSCYIQGVSPAALDSFYEPTAGYDPGSPFLLSFDASAAADSERYGSFEVVGDGEVAVGAKTFALAKKPGLSFSFNSRTGVFRGTARIAFESGRNVSGSYCGVLVPGWVLPCECGINAPEMPFGCGTLHFWDVIGGRSVKRSVPLILDKYK